MRDRHSPAVDVVRCESKQAKLEEFIAGAIAASREAEGAAASLASGWSLVARSPASPVVKAVWRLRRDQHAGSIGLRVLFLSLDAVVVEAGSAACSVRRVCDPRLADAHEQLVLGPSTCWIGDSMRRDPARCDAYESYAANCATTADFARTSFERMWQACRHDAINHPAGTMASSAAGADPAQAEAGLRAGVSGVGLRMRTSLTRN
jgi:hypothetical protein